MDPKEMREKRAEHVAALRKLADAADERALTPEENKEWKERNDAVDLLTDQIARSDRLTKLEAMQEERAEETLPGREDRGREAPQGGLASPDEMSMDEHRLVAMHAWARRDKGLPLSDQHMESVKRSGLNINATHFDLVLPREVGLTAEEVRNIRRMESRAMGVATPSAGGYLSPDGIVARVEKALLHFGSVRPAATIWRTDSGEDIPLISVNDTGNKGARIAENVAAGEQDFALASRTMRAHKYTSKMVRIAQELVEDDVMNFLAQLPDLLGERIARITEEEFTTGAGTTEPHGIVTASTLGQTAASQTVIDPDEVLQLVHSVDKSYRKGPKTGFMMSDAVFLHLRLKKDSNGLPIWQQSMSAGEPERLYGYPVYINNEMASSIAASAKTILFGALDKYVIRDVRSVRVFGSQHRHMEFDQNTYVAWSRHDGNLIDAGTNPVKFLQQAA